MAQDVMTETLDRVRRIEIRLTRFMEAMNVETGVFRPVWDNGSVLIPSNMSSFGDCLRVIPGNWPKDREVDLVLKDRVVAKLKVM